MIEEYKRQGFAFRSALLHTEEVGVLNDEIDRLLEQPDDGTKFIREKDGRTVRSVVNPQLWNDLFAQLVRNPKLLAAVEELVGEPVYAWQMAVNCKMAFSGDAWFWHQDYPAYYKDDHIPEPRMVNALIFLDEVNTLNGPLMLVPGSHELNVDVPEQSDGGTSYEFRYATRDVIETEVRRAGIAAPTGPRGSVIFMNVNTLHGSTGNMSPFPRRMITLTYNAMSNKATRRSVRPDHIVPDDRDVEALEALPAGVPAGSGLDCAPADLHALARPLWSDIDLGAITHNIEVIRKMAGRPVQLIVPVKANAYGHGIVEVARHLERIGVEGIATANADDAVAVRQAGVRLPIVLYGAQLPDGNEFLLEHDLTPTVYSRAGVDALAALAERTGQDINVHVKVDSGFGRIGVRLDEAEAFVRDVLARPGLELEGLYTHIPFGDADGEAWSRRRLAAFAELVARIESDNGIRIRFTQGAASAVFIRSFPDSLNTLSPGHLVYGLSPIPELQVGDFGLRRALRSLRSRLIHVGERRRGDDLCGTGPDGLSQDGKAGITLLGMDNGYRPATPGKTATVLCRGARCEVLLVTAEYVTIDLSNVPDAELGDVVTIIGEDGSDHISFEEVAETQAVPNAVYWLVGLKNIKHRYHC